MPVTVKLSERFYQKFGHELVDEMVNWFNQVDDTYRTELRELNELNFARFDAKLEQRVTQTEAKLEQRITQTEAKLEQRITQSEAKLELRLAELREGMAALRGEFRAALEAEGRSIIKWMFSFWIVAVTTIGGSVFAVLHFLPAARP